MPLHGPSLGSDRCQMESCNWIPFGFANGRSAGNSNYPKHWQWCQSKRSAADRRTLKRRCHPQACARRLGSAGGLKDPGFDIEGVPDVSSGGGIHKMLLSGGIYNRAKQVAGRRMAVGIDRLGVPVIVMLREVVIPFSFSPISPDEMLLIEESRDEYQANRNMPMRIVLLVDRSFVARDTIGVPDI